MVSISLNAIALLPVFCPYTLGQVTLNVSYIYFVVILVCLSKFSSFFSHALSIPSLNKSKAWIPRTE